MTRNSKCSVNLRSSYSTKLDDKKIKLQFKPENFEYICIFKSRGTSMSDNNIGEDCAYLRRIKIAFYYTSMIFGKTFNCT